MKIPRALYRLQFSPTFGFAAAKEIVPYLSQLGISDIYAAPIFMARAGSTHGYDIVDPNRLNPELGSADELAALMESVRRHDMGWIQDIVPNHMAYDGENQWLMDVLEKGPASEYADYFDIHWNHPDESIKARVLAPFLAASYGECLERGEIRLGYDRGGLNVRYFDLRLPIAAESYGTVLGQGLEMLRGCLGTAHPAVVKVAGALYALNNLPAAEARRERAEQIAFAKNLLWELYTQVGEIEAMIDACVGRFNGSAGVPESFNELERLLAQQFYRLSLWKVAAEELDYRRFFNINELISLRVEDEKVFNHTHSLIFECVRQGDFTGLRIDHIDGLYDPLVYLQRLRKAAGDIYLAVEKILGHEEMLPDNWPVEGTTGYDFLAYLNGIFCASDNEKPCTDLYARLSGIHGACADLTSEKKRLIIGKYMAGDIDGLARLLKSISSRDRHAADVTLYSLKRALVEVLTFFPVYRSYVSPQWTSAQDYQYRAAAIARAKEVNPGLLLELDFIERFLLLRYGDGASEDDQRRWIQFVMRFQQLTAPLMAKGFEDTTLFVYNRLLSLNNVGGDPNRFGISVDEFHGFNQHRCERWPHSINATSTHDTKRGEDATARINVLSELPAEWARQVEKWRAINRTKKTTVKGRAAPDDNDEYFYYQTLVGAYPLNGARDTDFGERLERYLIKAVREAKVHTEWLKPDLAYEEAFVRFVQEGLRPSEGNRFLHEFLPFAGRVAHYGVWNSLSQTLIKVTAPGVVDFYQGSELWNLAFVDPDNRRPIDFAQYKKTLDALAQRLRQDAPSLIAELLSTKLDGRIKLFLIYRALQARRAHARLFDNGSYRPVEIAGRYKDHVVAFARHFDDQWAIAVAPRLLTRLVDAGQSPIGAQVWHDTRLVIPDSAPKQWRDALCGQVISAARETPLGDVLRDFPVALLVSGSPRVGSSAW